MLDALAAQAVSEESANKPANSYHPSADEPSLLEDLKEDNWPMENELK